MLHVLEAHLAEPTARGIADAVTDAIRAGELAEGQRLPPIRDVASGLQVSPTTVSAAWALLSRAGSIRTDGRRGTTVATTGPIGPARYRRARELRTDFQLDLSSGVPDPELLPDLAPSLNRLRHFEHPTDYLDDPMLPELAEVIRRDWPYRPERLTVADGAMDAVDLISTVLLRFGDRVAVEQPGFPPILDLLEALGMRLMPIPLDEHGPSPRALRAAVEAGITAFFLQPRAHNPTGISMSVARAGELAAVLAGSDVLVVEDDSAGMIASSPARSLAQWLPEQVLHVRSYSKSHGPDLRLAVVSGPARHVEAIVERRHLGQGWTSRLLQLLLLDLLTDDVARAHVAAARSEYARRRDEVTTALRRHGVDLPPGDGLNLWLPVREETAAMLHLASRGIGAAAGAPFWVDSAPAPHIRLTVGLIRDQVDAVAATVAGGLVRGAVTGPR